MRFSFTRPDTDFTTSDRGFFTFMSNMNKNWNYSWGSSNKGAQVGISGLYNGKNYLISLGIDYAGLSAPYFHLPDKKMEVAFVAFAEENKEGVGFIPIQSFAIDLKGYKKIT